MREPAYCQDEKAQGGMRETTRRLKVNRHNNGFLPDGVGTIPSSSNWKAPPLLSPLDNLEYQESSQKRSILNHQPITSWRDRTLNWFLRMWLNRKWTYRNWGSGGISWCIWWWWRWTQISTLRKHLEFKLFPTKFLPNQSVISFKEVGKHREKAIPLVKADFKQKLKCFLTPLP